MRRSLRKAVAFLMAVTMVAGAGSIVANAAETGQAKSADVTVLAEAIYDEAVTFSDSVAFLKNGHWSNEDGENITKDTTIVFMDAEGNKTEFKNKDANGNQIFDAIYPMISDGYHNFDAFRIIKDGKMSYIRTDVDHPYYGESLQWYTYAKPINDDYMMVSNDGELTSIIDVNGEVILENLTDVWYASPVGNCVYVKNGNAVHVIYDGNKVRNYNRFEDEVYNFSNLGNGYGFVTGGEYNVLLDKDGNIVEAFMQVGNPEGTGVLAVDSVGVETIDSGYVVRRMQEKIWNPNGGYNYNYYYDVYNMETGEVVAESFFYPEFDGKVIVGTKMYDNGHNDPYVASVDGTTYIASVDDYVHSKLVTDSYEEATYQYYYVNGSLLISLTDWADMEEAETYVLTKETAFADGSKKHSDGVIQSISYNDEYVLTVDAEGYIDTMLTTKGNKVKEYGDTEYQYGWAISKEYMDETKYYSGELEGFSFITYNFGDNGNYLESQAYILEDGSTYEYPIVETTSGNFLLAYDGNEEEGPVIRVINADNKVVYSGACDYVDVFWYADYFAVGVEDRCYLYDRDGNKILGDDQQYISIGYNFGEGYYPAHDKDYYGKFDYYDECRPNGICVIMVADDGAIKYGAISLAEKEPAKNGLHYDAATGKWLYYVDGVVDTGFDGVADYDGKTWYIENGQVDFTKSGLHQRGKDWYYFKGGYVDTTFTGLTQYSGGWWYVENGKLEFDYTNLVYYGGSWWYVENSQITFKYDGVVDFNGATWYLEDSKVDFSKNGLYQRGDTWYYFKDGAVDYKFNGLTNSSVGWWYIENGIITFEYTGLTQYNGSWWYVENSHLNFKYDGVAANSGGTWYIEDSKVDFGKNGLYQRGSTWYYFKGGAVDYKFNGLTNSSVGWWYIENGIITFKYTGLTQYGGSWWYVEGSHLTFKYDGVATNSGGTWYIEDSKVDFSKNGLHQRGDWYYFKGGAVDYKFNGLTNSSVGWWYIENGIITFKYTGLTQYGGSWWYVEGSHLTFKYDGVATNSGGTWYIEDSKVDFSKSGLHQRGGTWYLFKGGAVNRIDSVEYYGGSWWYVDDGVIDFGYNGLGSNASGTWYIKNGKVDFGYNGTYEFEGETYKVVNGQATLAS